MTQRLASSSFQCLACRVTLTIIDSAPFLTKSWIHPWNSWISIGLFLLPPFASSLWIHSAPDPFFCWQVTFLTQIQFSSESEDWCFCAGGFSDACICASLEVACCHGSSMCDIVTGVSFALLSSNVSCHVFGRRIWTTFGFKTQVPVNAWKLFRSHVTTGKQFSRRTRPLSLPLALSLALSLSLCCLYQPSEKEISSTVKFDTHNILRDDRETSAAGCSTGCAWAATLNAMRTGKPLNLKNRMFNSQQDEIVKCQWRCCCDKQYSSP